MNSIAVGKSIFKENGINEHLLVNPKLTNFQRSFKLHTKEGTKGSQVLDAEGLLDLALDERQKSC